MRRNTLTRRHVLQMTTGTAMAAPLTLTASDTVAHRLTPHAGPIRAIEGVLLVRDLSPVRSPFHGEANRRVELAIAADGSAVLTIGAFDGSSDQLLDVPAAFARELDHALFGIETTRERRIRERRAAGWIDCPLYHYRGECHAGLCEDDIIHPTTVTRHLGPWFTPAEVAAQLHRVPVAWWAVVESDAYWYGGVPEGLRGTSEDGRVECVELQLHGLGWGAGYTPPGDLPDGPSITLWPTHGTHHVPVDPDHPVEWGAYLPGDPVHGATDTVAEALDAAVGSIAERLGTGLAVAGGGGLAAHLLPPLVHPSSRTRSRRGPGRSRGGPAGRR